MIEDFLALSIDKIGDGMPYSFSRVEMPTLSDCSVGTLRSASRVCQALEVSGLDWTSFHANLNSESDVAAFSITNRVT